MPERFVSARSLLGAGGDEAPEPRGVGEQRQHPAAPGFSDDEHRPPLCRLQQRLCAALERADGVQAGQPGQRGPDRLVLRAAGGELGDGMAPAGIGQAHLRRRLVDGRRSRRKQGDRQHVLDGRSGVVAGGEALITADHRERAAVADVGGDSVEVLRHPVRAMVEVLEDHQVERLELLLEDLLRGEGNERELVLRAVRIVSGRPQDEEADQVDVRVLLQELPEEAHVPRGAADHQEDAYAVADHLEDKGARIVLRDGLALVDRSGDGERELAGSVGNERQLDLVPRAAAVDVHRLLRDHLPFAAQHDRHVGRSETARGDHHVDRHLVAHEGEVVDGDPFHRQVLQRLRSDRQHEDRDVQPAQLRACRLRDALGQLRVVRPIAGDEETRERPASAASGSGGGQGPENVGGRTLRIGG